NRSDHPGIVDAQPGAAGLLVESGGDLGSIRPVSCGRPPRALDCLVPVRADDQRPGMTGTAQQDDGTHGRMRPPVLVSVPAARCARYNLRPTAMPSAAAAAPHYRDREIRDVEDRKS